MFEQRSWNADQTGGEELWKHALRVAYLAVFFVMWLAVMLAFVLGALAGTRVDWLAHAMLFVIPATLFAGAALELTFGVRLFRNPHRLFGS
jgi:hypothetical protein